MTRFIHDKFSKDYLETLLSPYGEVEVEKSITSEIKEIDVWFKPSGSEIPSQLGLLGLFCQTLALIEPYRNAVTINEIKDCLSKLFAVEQDLKREIKRNKQRLTDREKPFLWILTPTASERILKSFKAELVFNWGEGVYFLAESLRTAIVVIHQLPETPETLWLRLLGRGSTKSRAIDELNALSANNPLKPILLQLLYNFSRNLEASSLKSQEDRKFIMQLAPLYQQDREQAIQEGIEQGIEQGKHQEGISLILRLLTRKLGQISLKSRQTIEELSVEKLENLAEALLDFDNESDLINWLES